MTTRAPSAANARLMAAPIPPAPPVTRTVRPVSCVSAMVPIMPGDDHRWFTRGSPRCPTVAAT
ncbi:hypothetical protein [Actinophytocola glycyrrhizae]|uniref:Uncharacterized protein n=1 Tax=Actinophytocola glycyrrhizae TaxID=2044873 RepID=A0ABV9RUZ0_9PSEU